MMPADVAFDLARPSRRWLLVLSLLVHALVIAAVVAVQSRPERLVPERRAILCPLVRPPPRPSPICKTRVTAGHGSYCSRYFEVPDELVQLLCSRLSPELSRALRTWPYRADPCALWRKTTGPAPAETP